MKKKIIGLIIITTVLLSPIIYQPAGSQSEDSFFTIVAMTNPGGEGLEYLNLLKQQLAYVGIDIEIIVEEFDIISETLYNRDFDVCYASFSKGGLIPDFGGGVYPDFIGLYNENGSANLFGYHASMDYNETLGTGVNEWYMQYGTEIVPQNSEACTQHYWNWEQYLMDKILPCQPMFSKKNYSAHWSNLKGYSYKQGIFQSWGKMYFNGTHDGQLSTNELVITDEPWETLNPLKQNKTSSKFISDCCFEPLVWFDFDKSVWPHLATDWTFLNETHLRLHIREGIKWQPDPEGLFLNEYLDAEDVYFTCYLLKNLIGDEMQFNWLTKMEIIDQYTIDFYIDGDLEKAGAQPYNRILHEFNREMLPEHYLNQSQLGDGVSPDLADPAWENLANHCFGTGILEFNSYFENQETIMTVFDDCWWMNQTITADPALNWAERFGDRWELEQLRVKTSSEPLVNHLSFVKGLTDIEWGSNIFSCREELTRNPQISIQSKIAPSFEFLGYNMREARNTPLSSMEPCPNDSNMTVGLAVRKAISYALDREVMNSMFQKGEHKLNDYPIYETMGIWCNPNIIRYRHNIELAREYMTKAGYDMEPEEQQSVYVSIATGFEFWIGIVTTISVVIASVYIKKRKKQ